jgi:hypothetical protein
MIDNSVPRLIKMQYPLRHFQVQAAKEGGGHNRKNDKRWTQSCERESKGHSHNYPSTPSQFRL